MSKVGVPGDAPGFFARCAAFFKRHFSRLSSAETLPVAPELSTIRATSSASPGDSPLDNRDAIRSQIGVLDSLIRPSGARGTR